MSYLPKAFFFFLAFYLSAIVCLIFSYVRVSEMENFLTQLEGVFGRCLETLKEFPREILFHFSWRQVSAKLKMLKTGLSVVSEENEWIYGLIWLNWKVSGEIKSKKTIREFLNFTIVSIRSVVL